MHKIMGYLLICVGLLLIFVSLVGMYKVFVDRQPPVPVIQLTDTAVQTQYGALKVPLQAINPFLNLIFFGVFMFFILFTGGKIAGIGCKLLRTERIYEALLCAKNISPEQIDSLKKL